MLAMLRILAKLAALSKGQPVRMRMGEPLLTKDGEAAAGESPRALVEAAVRAYVNGGAKVTASEILGYVDGHGEIGWWWG